MSDEIKAAVERMRSVDITYMPVYPGGQKAFDSDCQILANAYLAEHPADECCEVSGTPGLATLLQSDAVRRMKWEDDSTLTLDIRVTINLKTRGDVRTASKFLAIPLTAKGTS